MHVRRLLVLLAVALAFSCGPEPNGTRSGTTGQALLLPSLTPVPCRSRSAGGTWAPPSDEQDALPIFDGTVVDLLTADALVQCAAANKNPQYPDYIAPNNIDHDYYLRWVVNKMRDTVPEGSGSPGFSNKQAQEQYRLTEQRWADIRSRPEYNCDPVTYEPGRPVGLDVNGGVHESIPVGSFIATVEGYSEVGVTAQSDLRTAGMNLCIAQYLRKASPGASSGETILLDEADQRSLLETIRERAQIAMLQYAMLGAVFALKPVYTLSSQLKALHPNQTVPVLEWWANECIAHNSEPGCTGDLASMGRDFATAVQLHTMVTEELGDLLARSSSARVKRGGDPSSRAADIWGAGAWKQRLEAMLFGGDPLGVEEGGPWKHPLDWPGPTTVDGWPDARRLPYFETDIREPQVAELMSLARRYDSLRLFRDSYCNFEFRLDDSAASLYNAVEAGLRKDTCAVQLSNGTCEADLSKLTPATTDPLSDMALWKQHRITRDHARTLVQHLAELLRFGDVPPGCGGSQKQDDSRVGPLNIKGTVTAFGSSADPGPVVIDPATQFVEPPVTDSAPKYTRFYQLRIPDSSEVAPFADSGSQGFHGCGYAGADACPAEVSWNTEAKRLMGAVSAQVAVRRSLVSSLVYLNTEVSAQKDRLNDYFAQSNEILAVLSGAIGDDSFSLRPWVVPQQDQAPVANLTVPVAVNGANELRNVWRIEGTIKDGDRFWNLVNGQQQNIVCAIESPYAGNLAAEPSSTIYGLTILDYLSNALANYTCGWAGRDPTSFDGFHAGPSRWTGSMWTRGPTLQLGTIPIKPTLVAIRINPPEVRLLGSQFSAWGSVSEVRQAHYLASGGQFGAFLEQQLAHDAFNPTQPLYDGFGYRTDWVPPLNAELVGGSAGDQSAQYFLGLAESSATEATSAVEKAIDGLIDTEHDEVAQAAAAAESRAGIQEEKQALCGSNEACAIQFVTRTLDPGWYPSAPTAPAGYPTCPTDPQGTAQTKQALSCLIYGLFDRLMQLEVKIAEPVVNQIDAPAAPAFSEYSGGTLQPALIKQWGVLRAPDEKFKALVAAAGAADAQMDVADVTLATLSEQVRQNCGGAGFVKGLVAMAGGGGLGAFTGQSDKCTELQGSLGIQKKKVIATQKEAFASIAAAMQGALDAEVAIQESSAEMDVLINQARLKTARDVLEGRLAAEQATTSFGLTRRYRAYDLWRAKALLENSRRYALAARRSIEARYVVDLSGLSQQESFVQSPASWADEVYSYDLSLPAAVGLATGEKQPGGIYSNKVKDYVTSLKAFVAGYAVSRPAAVAKDEIDVMTLPGLASEPIHISPTTGELCVAPYTGCLTRYPDRGNWLVHCEAADEWRELAPSQKASLACVGDCTFCDLVPDRVDRIRLEFSIDPWGRLNRGIATEPFNQRFNGRWGPLAVNVVGTGVKDCTLAQDSLGCYSEGYIPYNLTHVGPAWVTDYDEIWRLQGVPSGQIEGGKAIAAELWLDPLKDGWSTNYIGAVKRTEFEQRPLGGAYELEIAVAPEVQLDRIERIQLLVGSEYWVKQQ